MTKTHLLVFYDYRQEIGDKMMSIKKKTLRIPMNERLYGRKGCRVIAEKLLETGRIDSMTEGQLACEIFAHAYVFYNYRFVPKRLGQTDLFKRVLRSASDGVDLEDGGDSLIRRIAYRMIWLMPAFPIN